MSESAQATLDGDTTDEGRQRPSTLKWCDHCKEYALRSNWAEHEEHHRDARDLGRYGFSDSEPKEGAEDDDDGGLPEECKIETQTYTVEFSYEMVEQVRVEAANKSEAKRLAEEQQTHDGEVMMTLNTDSRSVSDSSQATEDYLKQFGLLPEEE